MRKRLSIALQNAKIKNFGKEKQDSPKKEKQEKKKKGIAVSLQQTGNF